MIGWLLLWQAAQPTVGDTIWIERLVGNPRGAVIRPQQWDLEPTGAQLGAAQVSYGAAGVTVRYPIALWHPGDQTLTMPGPVVVHGDGTSDTLPTSAHRVMVLSVLPAGQPKPALPPRPPRYPVPLGARSLLPLAALLGAAGSGLGLLAWRWRRKGKPPARPVPTVTEPSAELLTRWAAVGEYRAALHHWGWRLSLRLKASEDLADIAALQQVVEEIGDRTFIAGSPDRLAALAARAAELGKEPG